MDQVLSDLDFDDGVALPVANKENKSFEVELDKKQKQLSTVKYDIEMYLDRIVAMSDHAKNVRQELHTTQELCNARRREVETEQHLRQIADREDGRLRADIARVQKEIADIQFRRNNYENNIFKATVKLDELKEQMNWDQSALDAWLQESAQKDEDTMILQKYSKVDEGKIKELSLQQGRLVDEKANARKALEHEITQTLTSQLELDKTAEAFRKAHEERQELLSQWENTIHQMQKRDEEMDQAALRLAEMKIEVRSLEDLLKEKQQFLDNETLNNQEKEKKMSISERQAAKLRLDYQELEKIRLHYQGELETLKYTVYRSSKDLELMREKCLQLKREIKEKSDRLSRAQETKDDLVEQFKIVSESKMTAEERAQEMEKMLNKEEFRINHVEKELERLREIQFKRSQDLHRIHQTESDITAEIQGSQAASRNLTSTLNKLDQESLKQQEILYMQEFQTQQLERQLTRLQGERTNEEKTQLEEKIKMLTTILDEHQATHSLLSTQLKKLGDDLRRASRDISKGNEERSGLTSKIEELDLHNDNSERELKKLVKSKQHKMVDENILKLEIKRLRHQLNSKADGVHNLEKRKLLLEASMKERRHEISVHTDMLRAQMKSAEEERQTVSTELHARISKIDKLRKRYEILMVSMAPPEGEEEKSQAYYVIKAAQEKEELQRNGDELDAKIRKAEKEIRALENTLNLMNDRNQTYKDSFKKVGETSEEFRERQELEDQLRIVMDKYKYKRRQLKELQEDLAIMNENLQSLSAEEQDMVRVIEEKQSAMSGLNKELSEQHAKRDRADRQMDKLIRSVRSAKKVKGEFPQERDIAVRELKEFNENVMKQIGKAVYDNPDIAETVQMYFEQASLPMPPTPSSGQRSRQESARSSLTSVASSSRTSLSGRASTGGRQSIPTASLELGLFPDINQQDRVSSSSLRGSPSSRQASASSSVKQRASPANSRSASSSASSSRSASRLSASSSRSSLASKSSQKRVLDYDR